ncbi:M48 family metallopeptidase [Pseudobacter ginsenosidimutans]|uniref:Peptidase M48-like protein n=1 Tax=Pseudobacter ginsenosidimutans TaxID=661488 RepID=A0A4Q7N269_9BACT|nr:M48 family metallopeptidase [Pseudobacter ginsenosidimutans]QEC44128.1 M48 family metallopeptidase [Pseudobacter ginsenosidimutans]RZS75573.1 peptidase M48-like protein [Pseudobacter ginsenosidimutans]
MQKTLIAATLALGLVSCSQNAITGKNQLTLYSDADIQNMAAQQYRQFLSENKVVSTSTSKDAEMVRRIGQRLTTAINNYYTQKGLGSELSGYQWEYNLVNSNEVNAWCMPGGKIVVYTGLLPITQNEAALAVVMGHEIAHALAKHGNERMSRASLAELGGQALSVALANKSPIAQNIFMSAYGVGTNVGVMLPFGRNQELEADKFGLMFSAMAGYNPQEAIPLWERMEKAGGGNKPPEFLSTHPSEGRRIEELKKLMPEALTYYKPVGK